VPANHAVVVVPGLLAAAQGVVYGPAVPHEAACARRAFWKGAQVGIGRMLLIVPARQKLLSKEKKGHVARVV